jgi:hypothetical protein
MQMRRFHSADQRDLEEIREPHAHGRAVHCLVQLRKMHKALRMTPAMAAGISDKLYFMIDLAEMIDATLPKPAKRGLYKKFA